MINLRKLAEQQKERRALKIKYRVLKQTHDIKLAKSLSPITKKLDEATKKISEVIKESNSEDDYKSNIKAQPNSSKFSNSMHEMIGSLMNSRKSPKITQDGFGRANFLGVPIQISETDTMEINETIYELTPEIYKALSFTGYTGKIMKNENDILMMNNITNDLGYTGIGNRDSKKNILYNNTS